MKSEDIRNMPIDKIEQEIDDAREKLMRMRFQIATGELKDQNLPSTTRRDIARLLTILGEKRAQQPAEAPAEAKPVRKKAAKKPAKAEKKTEGEA